MPIPNARPRAKTMPRQPGPRTSTPLIRQPTRVEADASQAAPADDTGEDSLLTIREMCDAFDVTPRALRFYEARELLAPLRRGQSRFYSRRDRARMVLILRGKRFGFSLEQIRQLLDLYDPAGRNRAQVEATLAIARERLADMQRQQAELTLAIDDLARQIADAEAGLGTPTPPTA